jgi:hypothetical protein
MFAVPRFTRVKDKSTGHHYSVVHVDEDAHVVLKQPGEDKFGRPLPAKPNINKGSGDSSRAAESGSTPEKKEAPK